MELQNSRRNTRQRKTILQTVRQLGCHPTAEQIYDAVRRDLPNTSLSTVYRNLGILVDQGEITAVKGKSKELHYDHNVGEHCHIECSVCGRICDVDAFNVDIEQLNRRDFSGYKVEEVIVKLVGVCPECSGLAEKEKKE
jgi:Fe2+ or Zn2+ uptake regulation protein